MDSSWAWLGLYWIVSCAVPYRRKCRGYLTRYVLRRVPPKRIWANWPWNDVYRALVWVAINVLVIDVWIGTKSALSDVVFFGGYIILLLDDYLNGDDDDPKKRWEAVRNKIRWRMALPSVPEVGP